jgi:hypothetical protein
VALAKRVSYQKNFNANWICREVLKKLTFSPAPLMRPKAGDPRDAFGLLNWGVLKTLKHSARNCT